MVRFSVEVKYINVISSGLEGKIYGGNYFTRIAIAGPLWQNQGAFLNAQSPPMVTSIAMAVGRYEGS